MPGSLGKVITKGKGRRLVISDIHGCLNTFQALIKTLQISSDDQLFLLGDYVNKGPHSRGVIDYILELFEEVQLFPLIGNHDEMVLQFLKDQQPSQKLRLEELKNPDFFQLKPEELTRYLSFFSTLHHYFILDDFLLVHAGFDFNLANPFLGKEQMTNIRDFYYDSLKAQGKTIIHGHYPHPLKEIKHHIRMKEKIIPLDNGCVYQDVEGLGQLLCLDIDQMDLVAIQPKMDRL